MFKEKLSNFNTHTHTHLYIYIHICIYIIAICNPKCFLMLSHNYCPNFTMGLVVYSIRMFLQCLVDSIIAVHKHHNCINCSISNAEIANI